MAERIKARKEGEEDEREARENAFDEGLIGPGGNVAVRVENVILISLEEGEESSKDGVCEQRGDKSTDGNEGMIDLNLMPLDCAPTCNLENASRDPSRQAIGLEGHSFEGQDASSVVSNLDSDPFNLRPIIEAISRERMAKKRGLGEMEEHVNVNLVMLRG